jgi:hypothetical protein
MIVVVVVAQACVEVKGTLEAPVSPSTDQLGQPFPSSLREKALRIPTTNRSIQFGDSTPTVAAKKVTLLSLLWLLNPCLVS